MEGKPTNKFYPGFFIVNNSHGIHLNKKVQNILKIYSIKENLKELNYHSKND